jgi:hypothetical protein
MAIFFNPHRTPQAQSAFFLEPLQAFLLFSSLSEFFSAPHFSSKKNLW